MTHKSLWTLNALLLAVLYLPGSLLAQAFSVKPVRIIVPYAPNGLPDVLARVVAQAMALELGQQLVIDNKAGGSTIIGAEAAARSAPDGYTLFLMDNNSSSITPAVMAKIPYDPVRDFAPITQAVRGPFFLIANTALGAGSVQELIALARKRPGEINYASPGNATVHHITMEQLKLMAKIDLVHVPYKGVIQVTPALLSNEVSVMFNTLPSMIEHVKAGKLRILAVLRDGGRAPVDLRTEGKAGCQGARDTRALCRPLRNRAGRGGRTQPGLQCQRHRRGKGGEGRRN